MKKFASTSLLILAFVSSAGARAADAPLANNTAHGPATGPEAADITNRATSFGHQGQIIVSGTTNANLGGIFATGANQFNLNISPAASYFITDMVFVGGIFNLAYTNSNDVGVTQFNIGPTGGLHFPLGDNFSALPSLSLVVNVFGQSVNGFSSTASSFNIDLDGTFAYHVVPHFSFIFGPYFHQTVGDATASAIGLNFGVLGWI